MQAGVDEAGRGPLAGDVVAAAVIINPSQPIIGVTDSKKLTPQRREALYTVICARALAWAVGSASVAEIDKLNILQATLLAMQRAVAKLNLQPTEVLIDGTHSPRWHLPTKTIIGGDSTVPSISAASIIAKVIRDRYMLELDQQYPHYGFAQHKGYGTKQHLAALRRYGPCPQHRRSFAPVQKLVCQS